MEYVVYVIRQDQSKPRIKIGFTGDIESRLKQIQTGNPARCEVYALLKCKSKKHAMAIEADLHEKCEPHRTSGEWFTWGAINVIDMSKYGLEFEWIKPPITDDISPDEKNLDLYPKGLTWLLKKATFNNNLNELGEVKPKKGRIRKSRSVLVEKEVFRYIDDDRRETVTTFCSRIMQPPKPDLVVVNGSDVMIVWGGVLGECRIEFQKDCALFSCDTSVVKMDKVEMSPAFALRCVLAVSKALPIKESKARELMNA